MPAAYLTTMTLSEWSQLQDRFGRAFVQMGAPEQCALFHRTGEGGADEIAVFAPDDQVGLYGASTHWRKGEVTGDGWGLLVGRHDAAQTLGVRTGRAGRLA